MLTLLAFIVAIGILVVVHEWGHYIVAVLCGVKVLRFSVGFGPKVLGYRSKKSGTEFVLCAFPLGGYVKMLDEREGPVDPAELSRAFNTQPLRSRVAVVAAGPAANLLLAIFIYAGVNLVGSEQVAPIISRPVPDSVAARAGLVASDKVLRAGYEDEALEDVASFEELRWWLTRAALEQRTLALEVFAGGSDGVSGTSRAVTLDMSQVDSRNADASMFRAIGILGPFAPTGVREVIAGGAAAQAGLMPGDIVLQVGQESVTDAAHLRELIRQSGSSGKIQTQRWTVQRNGQQIVLDVLPRLENEGTLSIGRVGVDIGGTPETVVVRYGLLDAFAHSVARTWEVSDLTLRMLVKIFTGQSSLKNLSGPITIADYAGKSASMGATPFLVFLALVSISLGVLNLLPVPVLDGGHLMYYLWESLTGRPVSEQWMERLQKVGLAALMLMMSVAMFNDVSRLLG
jgi:regulator of sigma E protease